MLLKSDDRSCDLILYMNDSLFWHLSALTTTLDHTSGDNGNGNSNSNDGGWGGSGDGWKLGGIRCAIFVLLNFFFY
jgi:hypothetical protein